MAKKPINQKTIESLVHDEAKRKNIPTAEHESVVNQNDKRPIKIKYPRNTDLDPQLVWRGKDEQDWSDLVVNAPPIYIQEKVYPKVLIDDLLRQTKEEEYDSGAINADLFANFDGIAKDVDKTEFYSHDQNWSNRMILGDSLQVMASLAEREGLRSSVQCIYFDPPYGIKFNSNFQWSTTSKDVRDGNRDHITREPEMVKAFRDTWRDGIHSYMTYLRDRLTVARDLLTDSGSIFVQIGDENFHLVRTLLDEVFGSDNFVNQIIFQKTGQSGSMSKNSVADFILWYSKTQNPKIRPLFKSNDFDPKIHTDFKFIRTVDGLCRSLTKDEREGLSDIPKDSLPYQSVSVNSKDKSANTETPVVINGVKYFCPSQRHWSVDPQRIEKVYKAGYIEISGNTPRRRDFFHHTPGSLLTNMWTDTMGASDPIYVVQTNTKIVERCVLMATDPGDLVLDPTCGSGTTAYVSEQWGRRWLTIDTSRVALALARIRIMGAKFPSYLLSDSKEGQLKEAEITGKAKSISSISNNLKYGFVYQRAPYITLKTIADNMEIDVIIEKYEEKIKILLNELNENSSKKVDDSYSIDATDLDAKSHKVYLDLLAVVNQKQKEIDSSIVKNASVQLIYDKPYEDKNKVRVAGPFTVESLSPHRLLGVDADDALIDFNAGKNEIPKQTFTQIILENLKLSGVQQAHKENKILFSYLMPWPGNLVCAEGKYFEGSVANAVEKRAAIFIGPEFGTVQRADLIEAAREAGDGRFDVLIACAFNYDALATELNKLGSIPILKARMNADLHMSEDLKNTGKGNLFVIFGEPDIDVIQEAADKIRVKVNGVDIFKPQTGEVVSDGADGIACWFIDTDYNEESFFVRQAYFLGANDPYTSLKTTLKAEINADAWATLNSDVSRSFPKPKSGRIAVKVINHLGDEVMKVFKV